MGAVCLCSGSVRVVRGSVAVPCCLLCVGVTGGVCGCECVGKSLWACVGLVPGGAGSCASATLPSGSSVSARMVGDVCGVALASGAVCFGSCVVRVVRGGFVVSCCLLHVGATGGVCGGKCAGQELWACAVLGPGGVGACAARVRSRGAGYGSRREASMARPPPCLRRGRHVESHAADGLPYRLRCLSYCRCRGTPPASRWWCGVLLWGCGFLCRWVRLWVGRRGGVPVISSAVVAKHVDVGVGSQQP